MKRAALVVMSLALCTAAGFLLRGESGAQNNARPEQATPPQPAETAAASATYDDAGFRLGEQPLNASERAGREIWYKATAGNDRFHTYTFQQRIGVTIDWYRVLRADRRDDRFKAFGLINDPDCCAPGAPNCPAKSMEETYGFEYCQGDQELLKYVGKEGYRDPACDFRDAPLDANDVHGANDQRQSACDLRFGTSAGALGFRKFPNPRFDRERWLKLNGTLANWEGFGKRLSADAKLSDARVSHLADGSVEPPYLIGMSCGSCHIAFDPLNPPQDPAHPKWENIKGALGNQYIRISEILVSGMPKTSLEWQVFAHARPGTSDTSAVPTDQVNNPGTINAIINTNQRPIFPNEQVSRWRKVTACKEGTAQSACWCEPGRENKCWALSTQTETATHHILKGGEDSVGGLEAIQRVYFNIGSCAEACWVNHLTDLRQLDPENRNFGQTPFEIGQCRRDCPNFRAIEDRLSNIFDFLRSAETNATDLNAARETVLKQKNPAATYSRDDLIADLEKEFGAGAMTRGKTVFAETCARCHSSVPENTGGPFASRDFYALADNGLRQDWLGSDATTPVTEVGTFRCRALHSNHMAGHVWQQYGSETLRTRAAVPDIQEPHDGGRGYYRNISLLSLWAHAPFMHNNAIGPELCGKPAHKENDFHRARFVDADKKLLPAGKQPACWAYDPSVDGRFKLYRESMRQLLNPGTRGLALTKFDQPIDLDFGPKVFDGKDEKQVFGFALTIPAGANAGALGNFQHKRFVVDLVRSRTKPDELQASLGKEFGEGEGKALFDNLREISGEVVTDPGKLVDAVRKHPRILQAYSSCTADVENDGHRFGEDLSPADKNALIAFLATL